MIKYIKINKILIGLINHPLKIRVILFIILKVFGYKAFSNVSPLRKLIKTSLKNINIHLKNLNDHLHENNSEWIVNDVFTLADISWAVILHRIEEVGWSKILFKDKPFLSKYYARVKNKKSFINSINNYNHKILNKGVKNLKFKSKSDRNLSSLFNDL